MDRTSSSWHQHIAPLPPSHTNRELLLIPKNNPLLQQLLTCSKETLLQKQRIQLIPHRSGSHLLQHLLAVPWSTAAYMYPSCTAAPNQLFITTLYSTNITCAAPTLGAFPAASSPPCKWQSFECSSIPHRTHFSPFSLLPSTACNRLWWLSPYLTCLLCAVVLPACLPKLPSVGSVPHAQQKLTQMWSQAETLTCDCWLKAIAQFSSAIKYMIIQKWTYIQTIWTSLLFIIK